MSLHDHRPDTNALAAAVLFRAAVHVDAGADLLEPWPLLGPIRAAIDDVEIVARPDVVNLVHDARMRITPAWRGGREELASMLRCSGRSIGSGNGPLPRGANGR